MTIQWNVHLAYVVDSKLRYGIGSPGRLSLRLTGGIPAASQAYNWAFHEDVVTIPPRGSI
jgi:hypothetical protein